MVFGKLQPVILRIFSALVTAVLTLEFVGYIQNGIFVLDPAELLLGEITLVIGFLVLLYNIHPYLARLFNSQQFLEKTPRAHKVLEFLVVVIITFVLHYLLFTLPFAALYPDVQIPPERVRTSYFMIIAISLIYYYYFERERAQLAIRLSIIQSEKMSRENTEAQLMALRNQISPHFLFNSLNVLDNLIELDEDKANAFLDQLTRIYRVFLENADHRLVSLEKDLELAQAYIGLLKTRFSKNLHFELAVDDELKGLQLPPGVIQMLIENAIKHNGFSKSQPLTVSITSDTANQRLVVSNTVQPRKELVKSAGVGLKNIITRYSIFTDRMVEIKNNEKTFVVSLPLLTP